MKCGLSNPFLDLQANNWIYEAHGSRHRGSIVPISIPNRAGTLLKVSAIFLPPAHKHLRPHHLAFNSTNSSKNQPIHNS